MGAWPMDLAISYMGGTERFDGRLPCAIQNEPPALAGEQTHDQVALLQKILLKDGEGIFTRCLSSRR